MDALGDYVWPRATSELILLPVTGLECAGDRLLAGEAWWALVLLAGEGLVAPPGWSHGTKPCPREEGGQWSGDWAREVAGTQASPRRAGLERQNSCRGGSSS